MWLKLEIMKKKLGCKVLSLKKNTDKKIIINEKNKM